MSWSYFAGKAPQDPLNKVEVIHQNINEMSAYTYKLNDMEDSLAQDKCKILCAIVGCLQKEETLFQKKMYPYTDPDQTLRVFDYFMNIKKIMECAEDQYGVSKLNKPRPLGNSNITHFGAALVVTAGIAAVGHFVVPTIGSYVATYFVQQQLSTVVTAKFVSETALTTALLNAAATLKCAEEQIVFFKAVTSLISAPVGITFLIQNHFITPKSATLFNNLKLVIDDAINELAPVVGMKIEQIAKAHLQSIDNRGQFNFTS